MNDFMVKNPDLLFETNLEGVNRVKSDNNYAFLMESTSIEYHIVRECKLMKVGEPLDEKGYGIAMVKSMFCMWASAKTNKKSLRYSEIFPRIVGRNEAGDNINKLALTQYKEKIVFKKSFLEILKEPISLKSIALVISLNGTFSIRIIMVNDLHIFPKNQISWEW